MLTYFAYYRLAKGRYAQIIVERANGKPSSQRETGVTYASDKAAMADMERLNCRAA